MTRCFNPTRLLVCLALGGVALTGCDRTAGPPARAHAAIATQAVTLLPRPRTLPAFQLQRDGQPPITQNTLKGHWTLVFIGFTHCPDVCPTTLAQLAQAQKQWQALPEPSRPRVLFVSVDPDRDTPAIAQKYAHAFHPESLAATADLATLQAFTQALSLVFMRNPPQRGAPADVYSVDHSASIAVLDPQARMAGVITPPFNVAAIANDLTSLTRAAP